MAIICSNCGGKNYDENNVCLDCGHFVNGLPIGTLLDNRYQIMEAIKAGGMGAVYRAFDIRLQQDCAVKEMFNNISGSEQAEQIKRFMAEAKLLAGLNHPSIPRVIDYFSTGRDKYYLVMDYIKGKDLFTYVQEGGGYGLSEELVLKWAVEICDVLNYLHTQPQPILHRDLKPSNLMVRDKDRRIMLIDFGLAKATTLRSQAQKSVVGTMGYAAIEQYQGQPEPRSDIYSLGATMHFLLTGKESMPFKFSPISEERPDISEWMERVIMKALSLKAENRYISAEEMHRVLRGEIAIEDLIFNPDDMRGIDMSVIPGGKQKRGKKQAAEHHRYQEEVRSPKGERYEDHDREMDAKKLLNIAKRTRDRKMLDQIVNILLTDKEEDNRRIAATVLGDMGDERAVEPLIKSLLEQENEYIRINAIHALEKIGDLGILDILFDVYECDPSKEVRHEIRNMLINMGNRRKEGETIQFILDLIDDNDNKYTKILPDNPDLYFNSLKDLLVEFMRDQDSLKIRFHLGIIYYTYGYLSDSMRQFERAYKLKRNQPEILYFMGKIHQEKREFVDAIRAYENAMSINPTYTEVQDALIEVYYEQAQDDAKRGMYEEELEWYNRIISNFPKHRETVFIRGILLMKHNKTKEAKNHFSNYIKYNNKGKWLNEAEGFLKQQQDEPLVEKITSTLKGLFKKNK